MRKAHTRNISGLMFLALSFVMLLAQSGSHAQTNQEPLPYSRGYLVTGNFMTFTVDLTPSEARVA